MKVKHILDILKYCSREDEIVFEFNKTIMYTVAVDKAKELVMINTNPEAWEES